MNKKPNIVAIVGMEHFNRRVWDSVRGDLADEANVRNFNEHDLESKSPAAAAAIQDADCVFVSLINFKDQADFLRENLEKSSVKTVFAYESMPEVMSLIKIGDYVMANKASPQGGQAGGQKAGKSGGMPAPIKKVAMLLVNGREEDTLYGYTKLMKIMGAMMRFMPKKAKDFKNWMQVNIYWNQPLPANLTSMFKLILREYFDKKFEVPAVIEVPNTGVYHPDANHGDEVSFFKDLKAYRDWQKKRPTATAVVRNDARRSDSRRSKVALLFFRKHLVQERAYIDDTIRQLEKQGLEVLPLFVMGVEGHVVVREWLLKEDIDALINTLGFSLVGGPAGSTKAGAHMDAAQHILTTIDAPYIVAQPLYVQDFESWQQRGVGAMQSTALYALPEMDGAIDPVVLGAIEEGRFKSAPDRIERLCTLTRRWTELRHKANKDKRVAMVVYDYPPGVGKKATAALLDVPRSLLGLLQRLKREGYTVGDLPASAAALFAAIDTATDATHAAGRVVSREQYRDLTTAHERQRVDERWGAFPGDVAPVGRDQVFLGGLQFGNIYIGVQPRIGVQGDPMRLMFDKANTPHHQYLAFYRWLSRGFNADALIHIGMHGSVEWMPGLQLGMTDECWSDVLLGEVPHLYLYPMNNPSEANVAKRRGYATIISHAVPPMNRAGLYKELLALRDMLNDYRERQSSLDGSALEGDAGSSLQELITTKAALANLDNDCPRLQGEAFAAYASRLYTYVRELESRLITTSLHTFGDAPPVESQVITVTESLKARGNGHSLASLATRAIGGTSYSELSKRARAGDPQAVTQREQVDDVSRRFVEWTIFNNKPSAATTGGYAEVLDAMARDASAAQIVKQGRDMARLLADNHHELDAVVRGLRGRYIQPSAGGDLIRDGASVLPTGRNIHSIDPFRIPGEVAYARGAAIADAILEKHLEENGSYPETIGQVLWGLDTIKTKGESVACVMRLIGARPFHDEQGKISHYELISLEELRRPRIDVLMQLSPIFRDTFENLMDHLDKLVKTAAFAEEPHAMNFVKKHVDEQIAKGVTFHTATARQFTQAVGTYGTYVDDMIEDSAWEKEDDLDAQFIRRNSYAYGGDRKGERSPELLNSLLGTVGRVVQEVDSVEYGVADIDHYFSSSGALHMAARRRNKDGNVRLNYVETYTADTKIDDVEKVLRVEHRTKLLNPRWFEGMLQHGHSGAAEISNRFTYMLGWDAVRGSADDWVYAESAKTYALNPEMRARLEKANPQAMRNIVGRLLEASGRGIWKADDGTVDELKLIYADLEDRLEGARA